MRMLCCGLLLFGISAGWSSSKDKVQKVPYSQMASGMRDAFDCGVVVEKYLNGSLKGKDDDYHRLRREHNCDYVESVVKNAPEQPQQDQH